MATVNRSDRDPEQRRVTAAVPGRATGGASTVPRMGRPLLAGTFESLSVPEFRMLWVGTLLGMGSVQMQMIARTILVDDLTGRAFITGIVGLGFAPSMLILSMFGGVAGDRMEKRSLIQATQLLSAVMALALAILIATDAIRWQHLLVASILQGGTFAFQMPARQAIIPRLVGRERLTNAIALSSGGMSMMAIVAPALAGFIYGSLGPEYVYFIIAGLYLAAVIMTGRIPRVPPEGVEKGKRVFREVVAGFSYARNNRTVLLLLASGLIVAVLAMPFRLQFPVFARRIYGDFNGTTGLYEYDPNMIGLFLTLAGIGGVLGTMVVANLKEGNSRGMIVLAGAITSGIAILLFGSTEVVVVGLLVMVLVGLSESTRMTLGQSLSLENTEAGYRARVASIYMMTFGLMPLGALPLGFAVDEFGARVSLVVVGIVVTLAGLVFLGAAKTLRQLG